jgi:hypothetical protein
MDLNTLASKLRQQAADNSTIVLDGGVFSDAVLRKIRSAFALTGDTNLTVAGVQPADIPDPTAGGVLTIKAGTISVFKQSKVPVGLTFTAPANDLQAIIVAEMGNTWKFNDSFDGFDRFPFNLLEISRARFVYTTVAQSAYPWPGEPAVQISLTADLNFLSYVSFKNFETIRTLLGSLIGDISLSLKFHGALELKPDQPLPIGTLRAQLREGSFNVGVDPITLSLDDPAVAVRIGAATEDYPLQQIDLLVESTFKKKSLRVEVGIPQGGRPLEIITTPLPHSGSIDALIQALPGGQNFRTFIPNELSGLFEKVSLDSFSMIVAPKPKVTYMGLSIGTTEPWQIISGALELKELSLELETIEPMGFSWSRANIAATGKFLKSIFKADFAFTVELEKLTSWKIKTISGAYFGAVSLKEIVAGLPGGSANWVPEALSGIKFSNFGVNANREASASTFTYSFYGSVDAGFPIFDRQLTSALNLAVTKTGKTHQIHLGGGLAIGDQVFKLSLDLGTPNSKLTADWQTEGTPLGFGEIASAFGWDTMPELPEGFDLGLKDATITYDFKGGTVALKAHSINYGEIVFASLAKPATSPNPGKRVYLFSLDLPLNLKFNKLPVVGENLPADLGVDKLQIIATSAALDEEDLTALDNLITVETGKKRLIPDSLREGLTLAGILKLDGEHRVVVPLTGTRSIEPEPAPPVAAVEVTTPSQTALTAPAYRADAKWFTLNKTLGPVHFDKVGVQYQDSTLHFLLNAALSAAGLTLSVDGLSIGSSLSKFDPKFDLRGLGIDYKNDAVEIGGAFLRTVTAGKADRYDGAAIIKTKQLVLSALGSYTLDGQPSLFIYAFLDYPLGGPAFFFVTGLAAGFGYNRRLIAPSIENVAEFPLIKQAIDGRAGAPKDVITALESLQSHVPPSIGDIFLAIGVKFNSFRLIDSFALLTFEFGSRFVVNLLGLSTAVVPTPETGKTVTPLAQVQIAWKATFDPDEGRLAVDARLTPNSYILSKDCRLSGGYAFYSWFSGDHAGDFVQTLGGYHPDFEKTLPAHYPKVPRLAFNWRVSNSLTIQGDAYYALTGSALMAGGHLEVLFKEGELRAWLKLGADFLIGWKPYCYDARVYVNVGASYTFDIDLLLGHIRQTISVDIGADLHLWGPDFSGTAHIDLYVVSFTIAFGAGASQKLEPIKNWDTFKDSFLPKANMCSISVTNGLVRKMEEERTEHWIINPKELSLSIDSAIPFKSAVSGKGPNLVPANPKVDFGIAPMNVKSGDLSSALSITIKREHEDAEGAFKCEVVRKRVPLALWGEKLVPDEKDKKTFLENVPAGIEIRPLAELKPGETATINLEHFQYSDSDGSPYTWEPPGGFKPLPDTGDEQAIRDKIKAGIGSNPKRASLIAQMGVAVVVDITAGVADDFMSTPQLGTL